MLQFLLASLLLNTVLGKSLFDALGMGFTSLLDSVDAASKFMFGDSFADHFFAFKVLPTIIFFSSLISVLYHVGALQVAVRSAAWVMQKTLGTSGAETLATAANIFVGHTVAPLVIRPYVATMTRSELMALMVGGFATISGGVLAAFVELGIDAGHLLTASVISAPAALLVAKIMEPESGTPRTLGAVTIQVERNATNVIEAAANGAVEGLRLALNIGAVLIAFVALMALFNGFFGWLGAQFGFTGTQAWSLEAAFGLAFSPFALAMGVPLEECLLAGQLLGTKTVVNEFLAYENMSEVLKSADAAESSQSPSMSARTEVILTYALCGFANFSAIGIQLGGIGGMAPERTPDLAKLGLRAMAGGTLAAFMTACVAGILI